MCITETSIEVDEEIEKYEKLRKPIQNIINFSNTLDEKYREKCFEILLCNHLSTEKKTAAKTPETATAPEAFDLHASPDLRVFLQQYKITEEMINKLFLRQSGQTRPVYTVTEKRKPIVQLQIAMLTAFENALATPNSTFEFSIKAVRQRCVERNLYDGADFMNNFRNKAGLFTHLDNDSDTVKLSEVGKAELAKVILAVTKQ